MDNLHQLLTDARGDLPPRSAALDLDQISARGRRTIKRRRWSAVTAAVAVTLAAGSLIPFVRGEHRTNPIGPPTPNPQVFAAQMHGYPSGDLIVGASIQVTPGYEVAPITRAARVVGSVEVYRPGVFDPALFRGGTPVSIGDAAGFLHIGSSTVTYADGSKLATVESPALAWPYAGNAWAVVRSATDLTADTLRQLAERFTLGTPVPVEVPFRLGYVPPGYSTSTAGRVSLASVRDTTPGRLGEITLTTRKPFTVLTGPQHVDGITVLEERQPQGAPRHGTTCDAYGCYREVPGTGYYVGVLGRLPTSLLRAVTDGITTADPLRVSTWFPPPN